MHAGAAGLNSHSRSNIFGKIRALITGEPAGQFGLSGVSGMPFERVLSLMAEAGGFDPDPLVEDGDVYVDPALVIRSFEAIGDRMARAAERGEKVLLATGHPGGLLLLYQETARLLAGRGAKILRPLEGEVWRHRHHRWQVRYFHGVAALTERGTSLHTHRPEPMERMLEEAEPDLVFADHGLAGAAIEAGVETVSIADVNDPALLVAKSLGRTELVAVMDDNVEPESYWPCFQVIASRFPPE